MTRILRLLLIAAVAWPLCHSAAAQDAVTLLPAAQENVTQHDGRPDQGIRKVENQVRHNHKALDCAKPATSTGVQPTEVAKPKTSKPQVATGKELKSPVALKAQGKMNAPAVGPGVVLKAPPSGVTAEEWLIQTDWYDNGAYTSSSETGWILGTFGFNTVNVAIANGKVYIQGLSKYVRDGWIEGTISGTTVTFASGQDYGVDSDGNHHYFVGEKSQAVSNVTFSYDATNGILTQTAKNYINESQVTSGNNVLNGYGYHENMVLTKIKTKEMVTLTADEIRELPGFTYKYPINVANPTNDGTLLDVVEVTDELSAGHAIALLRAVYTNQDLPGPYYRGYTAAGQEEGSVSYSAVGSVTVESTSYENTGEDDYGYKYYKELLNGIDYGNTAGWDIGPKTQIQTAMFPAGDGSSTSHYKYFLLNGDSQSYYHQTQYAYFDPTDYRPNQEGYTLLLVEMQDNFKTSDVWDATNEKYKTFSTDPYQNLVQFMMKTVKSVRLLTESKRTGTNVDQGTLFKIDANKINRFFIISKGQSRYYKSSYVSTWGSFNYCDEPHFGLYRNANQSTYYFGYNDKDAEPLFYHMFEQFSPAMATNGDAKADIYKTLVTGLDATGTDKTGFPVYHDCLTVPYAEAEKIDATTGTGKGHEFKMLGDNDPLTSAPDVRDLLFFVPDYRLLYHTNTTYPDGSTQSRDNAVFTNDETIAQQFVYYNQDHAPRMDMYVIHLNPIEGEQVELNGVMQHVYQLELNWLSNMSTFLPAEEQEFSLWRIVTDANGATEYQPVYRVNAMGQYLDADGNVTTDPNEYVPVTMSGIYSLNELDYYDYVPMDATGKEVTYAVRGQDKDHWLSLQYSNAESYLIPGYDKNVRMTLKIDSDNSSKFDIQNEKNNYWNEIAVANNKGTSVTANFLKVGTVIKFSRWNHVITPGDSTVVATAEVVEKTNSTIKVKMTYFGQETFSGSRASENQEYFTFTYPTGQQEGVVEFGNWHFFDNFSVDVSMNAHPNSYVYRAYFEAAESFDLDELDENNQPIKSKDVFSNQRLFKVFKTDPSVNEPLTLDDVLADDHMSVTIPDNSKYAITAERSPLSELWRYEICRWPESGQVPSTFTYFGDVQNQGDEGYSTTFGLDSYKITGNVAAAEGMNVTNVELEDKELKDNGGAYYYVPQAVVYTKRIDDNTYGAPRANTALGKLDVEVVTPSETYPLMSESKWQDGNKWYSYYNILLSFKALNVPEGYELYKVRAWRNVDNTNNILKENTEMFPTRAARISGIDENGWYLYEDINYGDQLTLPENDGTFLTMSKANLKNQNAPKLGERSVAIAKPQNPGVTTEAEPLFADAVEGETRATFGAERLKLSDNDQYGSLEELNAEFKVRAYFTRSDNPLTNKEPGESMPKVLYVLGDGKTIHWWTSQSIANLYSTDGKVYTGNVTITKAVADNDSYGYFGFTTKLGNNWDAINAYRIGAWTEKYNWGGNYIVEDGDFGETLKLDDGEQGRGRSFKILPGTYKMKVTLDGDTKNLVITPAPANAPRAGELTGSDFDYYVAEGTVEFSSKDYDNIPTGIVQNLNTCQPVGVKYYNPAGIESDTPFKGVNIVVTRYSDGSTTTTKVLK